MHEIEYARAGVECRLRAPAKINLGLRLVGLRDDGYHLLESVFVPIDWSDRVHLRWQASGRLDVSLAVESGDSAQGVDAATLPTGADNLVHRAALRFLQTAGRTGSLAITLSKNLPLGAGLGGGSSDAAAVLRGLSEILPGACSASDCARLAVGIGADVPFFLDPRPAFVAGIGEQIEPLAWLPPLHLLLANPGVPLATPAVFRAFDMLRSGATGDAAGAVRRALEGWRASGTESPARRAASLSRLLVNDLEPAALRLCPAIGRLLRRLSELGATASGMSGSVATVYGVFESESDARSAAEAFAPAAPGWVRAVVSGGAE